MKTKNDELKFCEVEKHANAEKANTKQANTKKANAVGPQKESICGEELEVVISDDGLQANVKLLPPQNGGTMLRIDDVKQKLREAGVVYGVDEKVLMTLLKERRYDEVKTIATGTPPENGEDGKLAFHFSIDARTGSPIEIGHGKVDYRSLDLYVPVTKDQLLVSKSSATQGRPGVSVKGLELKQKQGKETALPRGRNIVYNEDRTEMYATCSGMVEFVSNCVNVSSVYNIHGDCDMSVGDINFDGSVHISGSVRSGHTIKATGGIVIGGGVEAATIIAGGNVEVKGGMMGADKGIIEAGGSVTILFVERGTVYAGGSITVDVSIHSYLESGDTLTARGRRGAIIGGHVGAFRNVVANYIGALSNARTEVVVGVMPSKRAHLQYLQKEIQRLECDQAKLDMLEEYLERSKPKMSKNTWEKLYNSGVENREINAKELAVYTKELEELKFELENVTDGRIHVLETVYSGARVLIGSDTYIANSEISFVSFRYNNGQIVYGSCELTKSA